MSERLLFALLTAALPLSAPGAALAQQVIYTVYGDSPDDHLGHSVSGAGDVDGDGCDDVVAAAHKDDDNGSECGSLRVYSGKDASVLYTFYGDSAGDWLGYWVSKAGDANNDGFPDIIAGAPYDDNAGPDSGSARVYSGKNGATLHTLNADSAYDRFGWSVSGAGDVNADGFADLIVGAVYDHKTGSNSGSATVFSGKDGATLYVFAGDSAFDQLGYSVGAAGDVNNDGHDDLVAGANRDDDVAPDCGMARVYCGKTGSSLYSIYGDSTNDWFGYSVGGAGDVSGDGVPDIIVGAPYDDNVWTDCGSAWVFSGVGGTVLYVFYGESGLDTFGMPVSGAGDVNGDGRADLVVGMHQDDKKGTDCGGARVFSGMNGAVLFSCYGDSAYDRFGSSVSGAGDVDSDGFADFMAGAGWDDDNGTESGSARVFRGSPCGTVLAYGCGCPGSGGFTPSLSAYGCLARGAGVSVEITGGLGGAFAFLFFGTQTAALPAGGACFVNVSPAMGPILLGKLYHTAPGAGHLTVETIVPWSACAGTIMIQAFIQDTVGAPGFSNTNGLQLTIQ